MDAHTINEIKELYSFGESIENIAERMGVKAKDISYYVGKFANSPPKRYIKDNDLREAEIFKLSNARGKSYKDILYLSYLRGKITQEAYESAFNN